MPRALAVEVIERVLEEDAYSSLALDAALKRADHLSARDKALATQIVYGTLTWLKALDVVLDRALKRGVRGTDPQVLTILRVALYQMLFLDRVPARAAIDEAVNQTKKRRLHARQGALVNGVLRAIDRLDPAPTWWRPGDRERRPARYLAERYALPSFFANRLVQQLGLEDAEREAASISCRVAPLWARARWNADTALGLSEVERSPLLTTALRFESLDETMRRALLEGQLAVQDLGSQFVGAMCAPLEGLSALDACAGLGGKSLNLLDAGAARVMSVEPLKAKLDLLHEALLGERERHEAYAGTIQQFALSRPEARFDLVLVDAPCTGLGVMRRHPEARHRKREADISTMAALQAEILETSSQLVAPGGALVYAVCSFTREEGPRQIERFLERHDAFRLEAPPPHPEVSSWEAVLDEHKHLVTWPSRHDADAFFCARMRRHET